MNTFARLAAGLVTAVIAVFFLFFLTTVGLFLALIAGVALFVGALSLRGKRTETEVGSFRVITFGSQPFGEQPGSQSSGEATAEQSRQQKALDDVVDLSPEEYRSVDTLADDKKKSA